jgi:hypothetical protein
MSIKRYTAEADTTITDAYKPDLVTRATASNMGASDSMEVFSLFAQTSTSSLEKSRALIKFPLTGLITDRAAGNLPASGNVNFFLRLFNAKHPFSLPREYYLEALAISQSWDEGYGLDMESYSDDGFGTRTGYGANWIYAASGTLWTTTGSSTTSSYAFSQYFKEGYEDLEMDVTPLIEEWISGTLPNNGFLIRLSGSYEDASRNTSFYTKKFFTRGTEYFFSKPVIEARWDSSAGDDRNNFYVTSALLSDTDNTQKLVFYNRVAGKLKNIHGNPNLQIKFYTDEALTNQISGVVASVSNSSVGVYSANVRLFTTASEIYDVWSNATTSVAYYSGTINPIRYEGSVNAVEKEYFINITNLKSKYGAQESVYFKLYSRQKDWQPTIYNIAFNEIENTPIKNLFYKILRLEDKLEVIPYSTGSIPYTKLSYDNTGNYFKFDMSILEPDYAYGLKFAIYDEIELKEFNQVFKFRVE